MVDGELVYLLLSRSQFGESIYSSSTESAVIVEIGVGGGSNGNSWKAESVVISEYLLVLVGRAALAHDPVPMADVGVSGQSREGSLGARLRKRR